MQLHYGGGYTVDYSPSEFSFYKKNGFDRVKAINFALDGEPGTPELPAVYLNYIVPQNAKVESLVVTHSNVIQLSDLRFIYPAQEGVPIGGIPPWTPPDSVIYNSDELFPGEFIRVVSDGIFDGARIVTVELMPLQYRPKSKRLYIIRNVNFEFAFGPNTIPELRPRIRGKCEQAVYDAAIRNTVVNDYEIPVYYQKPTLVEENQIGTLAPIPGAPGVIITDSSFFSVFQPYANWMTDQGIRTILLSTQYILQHFNGVDDAERVRNYIKWCYKYAGGTYFILGGDDYFVPVRYAWGPLYIYDTWLNPCDLYFSDLSGNWDVNGNQQWGEIDADSADRFPEVFVGRITAYTVDEVENWVTKALHYEKTPGVIFDEALWINDVFFNPLAHEKFPSYFTHIDVTRGFADQALEEIDMGYAFVNLNCHGNIGDFSPYTIPGGGRNTIYSWWPDTASQTRAGLNWLTNVNKYFFVYAICCHSGAYDQYAKAQWYPDGSDTCVADAFVDSYFYNHQGDQGPFGACAAVFNTRTPYAAWNEIQIYYYDALFRQPEDQADDTVYSYLGVAQAIAKAMHAPFWSVNWQNRNGAYCPNLFGSPVTEAWTRAPGNMLVTHPPQISVGIQTNFTVTVGTGTIPPTPLQYAKVCLNKTDDIYEVGSTDANGQVTFSITPQYGGPMKVTITRFHNIDTHYEQYRPSQTLCKVISTGGGGGQSAGSNTIAPEHLCITWMPTLIKGDVSIKYGVPEKNNVDLTVYNILGARVSLIRNEKLVPGYYEDMLDARDLASGVYFIVLKQGNDKVTRKFLLIK